MMLNFLKRLAYKQWFEKEDLINKQSIERLQIENAETLEKLSVLKKQQEVLTLDLEAFKIALGAVEKYVEEYAIEYFWTHKIKPRTSYLYAARFGNPINVLKFLNEKNDSTIIVEGTTNDLIANNALLHVRRKITYQLDKGEMWKYADETITDEFGDCEDGAILMANIMLKSGIPYYRVRVNVGPVQNGYHAYITYLKESDNEWYVLDWCYWPTLSQNFGLKWKDAENKYFDIDWSFDQKNAYVKDSLDRRT